MLNHNYIGTEHILLGLIHEGEGVAAKALASLGISLEAVRGEIEKLIGQGEQAPSGHIPFTPRAKKVLELSLREALQLGHNYIGTEHIILGLIREGEGVASQVLVKLGAELTVARQAVIEILTYGTRAPEHTAEQGWLSFQKSVQVGDGLNVQYDDVRVLDEVLTDVRQRKEAALDCQDFDKAAGLRRREKKLLAQRELLIDPSPVGTFTNKDDIISISDEIELEVQQLFDIRLAALQQATSLKFISIEDTLEAAQRFELFLLGKS
jgi:hypothetical protein